MSRSTNPETTSTVDWDQMRPQLREDIVEAYSRARASVPKELLLLHLDDIFRGRGRARNR